MENKMITLNAEYWDKRHFSDDTPWNLHLPSPPISAYVDQITDKNLSILVPGAGHIHEALYLIEQGFSNITVCDISEVAIKKMKSQLDITSKINYLTMDFFDIEETYDLILEQTFFCAIDRSLRQNYVEKMYELLKVNGTLAGVLFGIEFPHSGPPFGGNISEYKTLFSHKLHIHAMEICYNSISHRKGNEIFFICKKREI